ncbi:MAG TPA: hypothetical protein VHQ01_06600 [Pyrinomonadaceae bacterium]|nr:hypothetical protein [Pyrinomonadaceae bacterium]
MKRFLKTFLAAAIFTVAVSATSTFAQGRSCNSNNRRQENVSREYSNRNDRYDNGRYVNSGYQNGNYQYDNGQYANTSYQYGNSQYVNGGYIDNNGQYQNYPGQTVYDRHRKAINLTVATGTGAVVGALFGGTKGAMIGATVGLATGAIITAKQRPRNYPGY